LRDGGNGRSPEEFAMPTFEQELDVYLRARFTLIVLVTPEEERALQTVKTVCERFKRPCLTWDVADGFQALTQGSGSPPSARDAKTALEQIEKADGEAVYVLKDFHDCWNNFELKRKLRSVAQRLKFTKKSIIVTTPARKVPDELKDESVVIELLSPGALELGAVLHRLTQTPSVKVNLTELGREKLVQAALGLTASQAQRVFAKAIVAEGVLDDRGIDQVTQEKKQIISESKALEFYAVTETVDDVGGLDVLKEWLRLRERAFTREAREYGLPAPKGMALIGIPGTGKSLTAKMIGGLWRLPLLRLDVGALFGGLVGESEENTRRALRLAETVAPCVVWIDEMEKALAQGGLDGGTSTRVFGTILTWMAEKTAPCFVVATANDISRLPPELLRKGRFDEIFFLDLPIRAERQEIFRVHLTKRKRLPRDFDLERLARESEGYVGAEIEQAIIDAMYVGYNDRRREFSTEDISAALKRQVPISVSQREIIGALRRWLREGRAQSASFREIKQAEEQFVQLENNPEPAHGTDRS
jgi:AAA+ superfamily predicted ATPase